VRNRSQQILERGASGEGSQRDLYRVVLMAAVQGENIEAIMDRR